MHRASPLRNGEKRKLKAMKFKQSTLDVLERRAKSEKVSQTMFAEACILKAAPTIRFKLQAEDVRVPRNKTVAK